jgi:hypothetical protein
MEIATFLLTVARQFCPTLILADGRYFKAFASGLPIHSKNCSEAFQYTLGISQQLSYTLLAVPSGCPAAFNISQRIG